MPAASASPGLADPAGTDPLEGALRAAAVHAAAVVLTSAAQHLQRTTLLVEAATARALTRAGGVADLDADQDADRGLAIARGALAEAMRLFEAAQDQADRTLRSKRGES